MCSCQARHQENAKGLNVKKHGVVLSVAEGETMDQQIFTTVF